MNINLVLKRLELIKEGKGIGTISDIEASIILNKIERLNNIINELEKWLKNYIPLLEAGDIVEETTQDTLKEVLNKIKELKEDGSNEPSFEEMVGFVENVYKDIKSQPTLHEELEEERKTIAKIVGDFKEVNK